MLQCHNEHDVVQAKSAMVLPRSQPKASSVLDSWKHKYAIKAISALAREHLNPNVLSCPRCGAKDTPITEYSLVLDSPRLESKGASTCGSCQNLAKWRACTQELCYLMVLLYTNTVRKMHDEHVLCRIDMSVCPLFPTCLLQIVGVLWNPTHPVTSGFR